MTRLNAPSQYAKLLEEHDTWMFDCDGVLWQGDHLVPGAKEVLQLLRAQSSSEFYLFLVTPKIPINEHRETSIVRNKQRDQVT